MNKEEILNIKVDDTFYCSEAGSPHKCTAIHVHKEDDRLIGVLIKQWRVSKRRWDYRFFEYYFIQLLCNIKRKPH